MKGSKRKRDRSKEVDAKLRQADEALAKGASIAEVARSLGVSEVTLRRQLTLDRAWKAHPERFVRERPTAQEVPAEPWINRPEMQPSTAPSVTGRVSPMCPVRSVTYVTGCTLYSSSVDLIMTSSNPADIYKDGTYLKQHPNWHAEDSEWKAAHIRSMLRRNGLRPIRVCEVGCGAGEILRLLAISDPGAQYAGFEISPDAFELCSRKRLANLQFHHSDLLAQPEEFDLLLCIDVIEHIEDYIGFARRLRDKAKWKLFHIPLEVNVSTVLRDAMMKSRESAGHLHYFTRASAIATLRDAGYQVVDWRYTRLWIGLPARTWMTTVASIPRHLIYAASPDLCVRLIGGCSLLVLAK